MPDTNSQKDESWAAQVEACSNSDTRTKPWEDVIDAAAVDNTEGDVIDVNVNPQGASDISVSA
jgi:hypothetical protein